MCVFRCDGPNKSLYDDVSVKWEVLQMMSEEWAVQTGGVTDRKSGGVFIRADADQWFSTLVC